MLQFRFPPPSSKTFLMLILRRRISKCRRKTRDPVPQVRTVAPAFFKASTLWSGALDVTAMIVRARDAVLITYASGGVRALLSIMILQGLRPRRNFTVSLGSSASKVPTPTIIPSTEARSLWTRLTSSGDESLDSPVDVAIFPSRLIEEFRIT